ncbi:MAG TPA: hypothetical protein VG411_19985, partial [Actinomycetota bacterium]|nr:hypothetical protein [Actinomycetota bacterium]
MPLLAVTLPQFSERPGPALESAIDARRLGFAGAFVFDHLWPLGGPRTRPALECWTLLAAVAAATGGPEGPGRRGPGNPEGVPRSVGELSQGGAPVNRPAIGIVSVRLGGPDGVSVVAGHWAEA